MVSTTTFMLGSTVWFIGGEYSSSTVSVRVANQNSPSCEVRKVNFPRSGVVLLLGSQWNPESSETQS